jgi:hypothetical protein
LGGSLQKLQKEHKMNSLKFQQKFIGVIVTVIILAGCATPKATPKVPFPPPPQPSFPSPPQQTLPPPPATMQPAQPTEQFSLFKHIQTVKVIPSELFSVGAGGDILYIPASDRIVVILTAEIDHSMTLPTSEVCDSSVVGYVEYTTGMQPTGKYGYLACGSGDLHARSFGNDVFIAKMRPGGGYTLLKYDGVTWKRLATRDVEFDNEEEWGNGGGPDPSFINGQFVVTGEYIRGGTVFGGSHNMIFDTDLAFVKTILLSRPDVPAHHGEYSLLQLINGDILLFASATPAEGNGPPPKGDLEVLRFDNDWHYLEQKWLRDHAVYPTGSATDGRYVYVTYLDWTRPETQASQNVGLAAFDAQWNLIEDVVFTDVQSIGDFTYAENDSIVLLGNRVYVHYVIHVLDPNTGRPDFSHDQTYVDVFELNQNP